jgi:hypothetical protein
MALRAVQAQAGHRSIGRAARWRQDVAEPA